MFAQETWLDEDFSALQWKDAFTTAGLAIPTVSVVTEISGTFSTTLLKQKEYGGITGNQGYLINGAWSGYWSGDVDPNLALTGVDGRKITNSVRLRSSSVSFIQLPKVLNAGKISIYVRNSNATTSTSFSLQKLNDDGITWMDLTSFTTVGADLYPIGIGEERFDYELNSNTPVTLRIYKNTSRFMNVFKFTVNKYSATELNSVSLQQKDVFIVHKTLNINKVLSGFLNVQVVDLTGKIVFRTQSINKQIQLPESLIAGIYFVKIKSNKCDYFKKLIVN